MGEAIAELIRLFRDLISLLKKEKAYPKPKRSIDELNETEMKILRSNYIEAGKDTAVLKPTPAVIGLEYDGFLIKMKEGGSLVFYKINPVVKKALQKRFKVKG